jgi:acetolactate synthase-1/3 small subunit
MGEPGTAEVLNLEDLEAVSGLRTGRKHVVSILVVGPTDDPTTSRITLTVDGAAHPIDQVTKQLHKLVNVLKIRDLEPEEMVARELALFKLSADAETRPQILQYTEIFRGKIVDVDKRSVTVEITGADDKIEAFERMVRPFGLIEMVRTGEIAVARGRGAT